VTVRGYGRWPRGGFLPPTRRSLRALRSLSPNYVRSGSMTALAPLPQAPPCGGEEPTTRPRETVVSLGRSPHRPHHWRDEPYGMPELYAPLLKQRCLSSGRAGLPLRYRPA